MPTQAALSHNSGPCLLLPAGIDENVYSFLFGYRLYKFNSSCAPQITRYDKICTHTTGSMAAGQKGRQKYNKQKLIILDAEFI
jgi:hypothetical protein